MYVQPVLALVRLWLRILQHILDVLRFRVPLQILNNFDVLPNESSAGLKVHERFEGLVDVFLRQQYFYLSDNAGLLHSNLLKLTAGEVEDVVDCQRGREVSEQNRVVQEKEGRHWLLELVVEHFN